MKTIIGTLILNGVLIVLFNEVMCFMKIPEKIVKSIITRLIIATIIAEIILMFYI